MSKDARGKKRHCKACGAKFYDLGKEPVVCAVCGAPLNEDKAAKPPPPPPAKEEAATEPAEESSKESAEGPEFISLEEAEEAESGAGDAPEIEDEEAIADLDDEESSELPDGEDDDTFLEEEDDGEPDVEGIIGAPIKSEE